MACRVPANQMIYQALLNKAASYTDQPYKAKAYKKAAESVAAWLYDLRNDYVDAVPNVGPSISKFIEDFINHPCSISFCSTCQLAEVPSVPQCKVPANQPIYEALLAKAASYPAEKPYQAKAYKKIAESVLNHTWDINEIAKKGTWWQGQGQYIPGIGEGTRQFINDFIAGRQPVAPATPTAAPKPLTPREVVETVKQNVQARATGGGVSSAQMSSFVRQNALSRQRAAPETKGSGPFGYLADADEAEEKETTLIPRTKKLTVQQLIDALQGAIEKNPAVATVQFYTTWDEWDNSGWGPYELSVDGEGVYLHCGDPDIPKY